MTRLATSAGGFSGLFKWSVLLVPALLLTGCRPQSGDEAGRGAEASARSWLETQPPPDYFEKTKGRSGGTLRISNSRDIGTLDPHVAIGGQWQPLFDSLVYLDEQGNATPWLATSWTISPDGRTYTFKLREDVTFSDGSRFDAEAVRLNLARVRDPATKTAVASAYLGPYVDGTVVDEFTFQANLAEPYSPFLSYLATVYLGMVSPKQIRERPQDIAEKPIGSGPFSLESYTRNQGIRFTKRPDYDWSPPFVRHEGAAYLDRIEVDFVPEDVSRYSSLVSGQYDLTMDMPAQYARSARDSGRVVVTNSIIKGYPVPGIIFNTARAPFDDVKVRRAVALAVDREGIAQMLGFGELLPKADFLSSNSRFYDPSFRDALKYDPVEAGRLLDEAGWTERDAEGRRVKNGVPLFADVLVGTPSLPSSIIVAVQSDAKKIGLELKIMNLPGPQMLARRNTGDYQAIVNSFWFMNTPDVLYVLFHSRQIITETHIGQNYARLSDTELDDLLTGARHAGGRDELRTLYGAVQRRLTELVPSVPVYENQARMAWRTNVRGVFDTSYDRPFYTTYWLAE